MIKLKVFWLTKYTEEKPLPLYRSTVEPENTCSINVKENMPFNHLIITNPKNSNLIYTLHYLYFRSSECTALKLYMTDNINLDCKKRQGEILEIRCLDNNLNNSSMTELSTLICASSLLTDNYMILIPGGNIIIKTNTPILKGELSMKYTIEKL